MSSGGIVQSRHRVIDLALVWGVMFIDVYQIAAIALPSLLFALQPGEWGPLPVYAVPKQLALISLTLICAVGVLLARRAFAYLLLALVALYAGSEILSVVMVAREWNVDVVEGDHIDFDWFSGSLYMLKWFSLAIGSAFVFLGPIGKRYFSREVAPKPG